MLDSEHFVTASTECRYRARNLDLKAATAKRRCHTPEKSDAE